MSFILALYFRTVWVSAVLGTVFAPGSGVMKITQISPHVIGMALEVASQARCRPERVCPPERAVTGSSGADSEANAASRRALEFWAFLERENQRHPGTVEGSAGRKAPACPGAGEPSRGADARVVSYGMPKLGSVPGPEAGSGVAPGRVVQTLHREVFTPTGTRFDILA
jgi:hypothetical protein